jgi:hypothetical protein
MRVASRAEHARDGAKVHTCASHMANWIADVQKSCTVRELQPPRLAAIFSRFGTEFLNISLFSFGIILHFVFSAGN